MGIKLCLIDLNSVSSSYMRLRSNIHILHCAGVGFLLDVVLFPFLPQSSSLSFTFHEDEHISFSDWSLDVSYDASCCFEEFDSDLRYSSS